MTIDALLTERAGYVIRGLGWRVAQVDAELARLGHHVPSTGDDETAARSDVPVEGTPPPKPRRRKAG